MLFSFSSLSRLAAVVLSGAALIGTMSLPGSAQMREQIKDRMIDKAADKMVSQIQTDSCPEFESMLKSKKSGGSSSSKSGMLKSDPAARQRFVNKVAGPLLNKMIDCNLLPGH